MLTTDAKSWQKLNLTLIDFWFLVF